MSADRSAEGVTEPATGKVRSLFDDSDSADRAAAGLKLPDSATRWHDAQLVATLLAIDPVGLGGVHLQSPPGAVRDAWLHQLKACTESLGDPSVMRRMPQHADDSRLIGGLDLTATLKEGRPVLQPGLLSELDGHLLVCPMAERLPRRTVSHLAHSMDQGEVRIERDGLSHTHPSRFALVALDEADANAEEPPIEVALSERMAFRLNLEGIDWRLTGLDPWSTGGEGKSIASNSAELGLPPTEELPSPGELSSARKMLATVSIPEAVVTAMVQASVALGVTSLRAPWWAVQAARALAALRGLSAPGSDEVVDAARLVLGPRATQLPASPQDLEEEEAEPAESRAADPAPDESPAAPDFNPPEETRDREEPKRSEPQAEEQSAQDLTVAAMTAALPAGLLAMMARQNGLSAGKRSRAAAQMASRAGERERTGARGRPVGIRPGLPEQGHRLSVIDTLRQAAPWQSVRRGMQDLAANAAGQGSENVEHVRKGPRILVSRQDLRIVSREPRRPTTTIFVVDASGSNALNRLAEAKGAVESLLADCYVRRDRVAVLGFRGQTSETLLPPTRSLVRAKRSLAGLPGGGGTPMARALVDARLLCEGLVRRGDTVSLVLLTDGKANVTLQGRPGREQAHADAIQSARELGATGVRCLLVDTSPKPQAQARELALAMAARYIPLPQARTGEIGRVVRNSLAG